MKHSWQGAPQARRALHAPLKRVWALICKSHAESEKRARLRTLFDSDRDERSWRTVEPAWIDTGNDVNQADHQALADNIGGLDRDHGGKNAGEERV